MDKNNANLNATLSFDETFYAALIETMQDGVFVVKRGVFVLLNQAFADMLGFSKKTLLGSSFADYIVPEHAGMVAERYSARLKGDQPPNQYEFEVIHADGHRLTVQVKSNAFNSEADDAYIVCSLRDITLEKQLLAKLKESEKEMRQIIVNLPGIFYRTDVSGVIIMASPYSMALLGFDEDEVVGKPLSQFYAEPHQRAEALTRIMQGGGNPVEVESLLRRKDGSTIWVSTSAFARYDSQGNFCGVEGISRNITERKNMEAELRDMAVKDQLTGMMNRFGLQEHLEQALNRAKRRHSQVSIIFIDLDEFKLVNDLHGHQVGDQYLVEYSRRLVRSFRESDLVCRIGGDEFVILLDENTLSDSLAHLLVRLQRIMKEPMTVGDAEIPFLYSYGVANFPENGRTASGLLNYADQQMYLAKKQRLTTDK